MISEALDLLWQCATFGDDEFHDAIVEFCQYWHKYAPNLCQWLLDNKVEISDFDECKALFADEIERANKLYMNYKHEKEIRAAGVAFRL